MRFSLLSLFFIGCATTAASLQTEAPRCDSFAAFDARARAELDRLAERAPGDELMRETSRLNQARRQCARHVLEASVSTREAEGAEHLQRELDAMVQAFSRETLDALLLETVGDALAPQVAEARAGTRTPHVDPEPAAPSLCDEALPCAQFHCVTEKAERQDAAARACLDSLNGKDPLVRALGVRDVLLALPMDPSGARTEASSQLEGLRRQLWPKVEQLEARGLLARAAELATPFDLSPGFRDQVLRLRDAARVQQLALAEKTSSPALGWLHRRVAAQFGAAPVDLPPSPSQWRPSRWVCGDEPPKLPALPWGLSAQLTGRCEKQQAGKGGSTDELRTFELESELSSRRVTGKVVVFCADLERLQTLNAYERELLELDLQHAIDQSLEPCARAHDAAAERDCAALDLEDSAAAKAVEHALAMRRWPACFARWWAAKYGVSLPELR